MASRLESKKFLGLLLLGIVLVSMGTILVVSYNTQPATVPQKFFNPQAVQQRNTHMNTTEEGEEQKNNTLSGEVSSQNVDASSKKAPPSSIEPKADTPSPADSQDFIKPITPNDLISAKLRLKPVEMNSEKPKTEDVVSLIDNLKPAQLTELSPDEKRKLRRKLARSVQDKKLRNERKIESVEHVSAESESTVTPAWMLFGTTELDKANVLSAISLPKSPKINAVNNPLFELFSKSREKDVEGFKLRKLWWIHQLSRGKTTKELAEKSGILFPGASEPFFEDDSFVGKLFEAFSFVEELNATLNRKIEQTDELRDIACTLYTIHGDSLLNDPQGFGLDWIDRLSMENRKEYFQRLLASDRDYDYPPNLNYFPLS